MRGKEDIDKKFSNHDEIFLFRPRTTTLFKILAGLSNPLLTQTKKVREPDHGMEKCSSGSLYKNK